METAAEAPSSNITPCPQCGTGIRFRVDPHTQRRSCPHCGYVLPSRISHFELRDIIGTGGMGAVYRGFDISLERAVAVKVMREELARNPQFVENFLREARAAAALNHPNIAQIYSFGEENGRYYLVMELLPNGSLDDRIEEIKRLPEVAVLDIGIQVASGLRAACERNLIHRDIKPGNILFSQDGVAKVVDFGLARFESMARTHQEEGIWGTPYYIAPEKVAESREDFRSDIYSLGGTLFHALAGRAPFEAGTSTEVVLKHLRSPSVSLLAFAPDCTTQTADVIGRMLKRDPAERPQSYDEVLNDLAYAKRFALEKKPVEVAEEKTEFSMAMLVGTLLMIICCIAVVIVFWIYRYSIFGEPPKPQPVAAQTNQNNQVTGPDVTVVETNKPPQPPKPPEPPPPTDYAREVETAHDPVLAENFERAIARLQEIEKEMTAKSPANAALPWCKLDALRIRMIREKPEDLAASLQPLASSLNPDALPATIDASHYVAFLALVLQGKVSGEPLNKALAPLPAWMQAIGKFDAGLMALKNGRIDEGVQLWKTYHQTPRQDEQQWAYSFRTFVSNSVAEIDSFKNMMARVEEFKSKGQLKEIQQLFQEKQSEWKCPPIVSYVSKAFTDIQQQITAKQKELDEKKKKEHEMLLEKEKLLLAPMRTSNPAYLKAYKFDRLLADWKKLESEIKTDENHATAITQLAIAQCFNDFREGLAQDIKEFPYDQDKRGIVTTGNRKPAGKLVMLSGDNLVFRLEMGNNFAESKPLITEFAPSALIELGDFYLQRKQTAREPNASEVARRSISLAVFAREYGLPETVFQKYASIAKQTGADVKDLAERLKLDSSQPQSLK
jgi:ribosomal protein S27AE